MKLDGFARGFGDVLWHVDELPPSLGPRRDALRRLVDDFRVNGVPIAPTALPFDRDTAIRPREHRRSYYLRAARGEEAATDHVAVKGTEVQLIDELQAIAASGLPLAWRGKAAWIDFFPIHEHKVPMALTTGEALRESRIGHEIHARYVARYGELPDLPMPLLVVRWQPDLVERFRQALHPLLSPMSDEIVKRLLVDGASSYVYHYPVAPYPRVRHLAADLRDAGKERMKRLAASGNPRGVVQRWIDLFVRLLALGYITATPSQLTTGQSVQAQNCVVGGGFVDLDSVRAAQEIKHPQDFVESYTLSILVLANSIAMYLFPGVSESFGSNAQDVLTLQWTFDLVARGIEDEVRLRGDDFDARLRTLPPFSHDLDSMLAAAEGFGHLPRLDVLTRLVDGKLGA